MAGKFHNGPRRALAGVLAEYGFGQFSRDRELGPIPGSFMIDGGV